MNADASCTPATRPLAAAMRSVSDEKWSAFVDFENTEAKQRKRAANQEASDKAGQGKNTKARQRKRAGIRDRAKAGIQPQTLLQISPALFCARS